MISKKYLALNISNLYKNRTIDAIIEPNKISDDMFIDVLKNKLAYKKKRTP